MRLAVLSEDPAGWRREARAWSRLNAKHRTASSGEWVPGPRTEYYLYQTLVASFEGDVSPEYIDRIAGHMIKAAREAGLHTSWTEPNEPYEKALGAFTRAALDARLSPRFLDRLGAFVARIEPAARLNSLGLVVLKCLAPGVPDMYQGCEFPSLMLTDPDNRQPVDFEAARQRLDSISAECPPGSSDRKPWLLQRLLRLRAEMPALFAEGGYEAIEVEGPSADQVLAFARTTEREAVAAAIPRLVWGHIGPEGCPELAAGTSLQLPPGYRWNEAFSGRAIGSQSRVDLATRLLEAPVAVFRGVRP
jgi:(1->4)-alpha-D-glucan 1-alpha-D-glucosylmutase